MMKALIMTEGGKLFGLGHVSRCTAIYDALENRGYYPFFIVNGDQSVMKSLGGRRAHIEMWHNNVQHTLSLLQDVDLIIIDSYHTTQKDALLFSEFPSKLIVIEDYIRLNYTNSIIVDWSLDAENLACYKIKENSNTYLLGTDYLTLRESFWKSLPEIKRISPSILVTMGGSDLRNLSLPIINTINSHFPYLRINLIIGPDVENREELLGLDINNIQVYDAPDQWQISQVMADSDLAISGGGQTLYELFIKNVNILAIELINNQHEELLKWERQNLLSHLGAWDDSELFDNMTNQIEQFIVNWDQYNTRDTWVKMDCKGVFRIIDALEDLNQ